MVSPSSKESGANATIQTLQKFRRNPWGLWRGYTALAGRNLPFTAMQFPLFERFKEWLKDYRKRKGVYSGTLLESGLVTAASAGVAGSIAAVVTTPIDVVKTRIMLAAGDSQGQNSSSVAGVAERVKEGGLKDAMGHVVKRKSPRKSSVQIGREIVAEQGIKGLWRGGALRGVWTMLGSGLYLGTYESGRIWLAKRRGEELNEEDLL
jgi:solute carrier family 25 S-adenosylmethionine transporter 26